MNQQLLKAINELVNVKPSGLTEKIIASLNSGWFIYYKASGVLTQNRERKDSKASQKETVHIVPYTGENAAVKSMMNYLDKNLNTDLVGAYIHGSLATGEEIAYSDFDALVIIKDEVFENKQRFIKVCRKLNASLRIMYEYDPLQHHGWFVLCESHLKNYPVTFFPPQLFPYSKSLLSSSGRQLHINFENTACDFKIPAINLITELEKKLSLRNIPENAFQLKSILSEFMLLPAFFYQAKNSKSIYKKFSFTETKKYFTEQEWVIMDTVSEIRKNWRKPVFRNRIIKNIYSSENYLIKKLVKKLPLFFDNNNLNFDIKIQMLDFIKAAKAKI